jgi:type I restriction enzyme, S subunit
VALPAIEEQKGIAEYLQVKVAKMGKVLASSEAAIDLLQERRTALISAAVTGKIDVRGWKAPEPQSTRKSYERST